MVSSFRRKWPTFLKYSAIGAAALVFSTTPVSAQDVKQQQIDVLNSRLEKLEQQNQKLMQMLEQQKQQAIVPTGMAPSSVNNQPEDVKKVVEKILKDKEDAKKADDEKKKKEAADKGHEVGSDLKLSTSWDSGIKFDTAEKDFTLKIGGRINYDSTLWSASSLMQRAAAPSVSPTQTGVGAGVGPLDDGMFIRRARIEFSGTVYEQFEYQAELDFETLNVTSYDHMWLGMKELPLVGTVRVGQQKVPMGLESYSSSKNLMFMERSTQFDAFWSEFAPGVYITNTMFEERATWHAMFSRIEQFNTASGADFGDGDYAYTGRVTFLPVYEADGRCLVHVGASYQWRRADLGRSQVATGTNPAFTDPLGLIRFRARPELRDGVGSGVFAEGNPNRFVDTGNMIADSASIAAGELFVVQGPITIQSEATIAQVQNARFPANATNTSRGTPTFWGAYAEVGYCLTGENRGYEKRFGAAGTIKPYEPVFAVKDEDGCFHRGWGAWELCYRYSIMDLNDEGSNILGGKLTEQTVGVNWWLTQNMRLQMNYINAYRDVITPATSGTVHGLGLRAIVVF